MTDLLAEHNHNLKCMALMGSALHYFRIHVILTNSTTSGYFSRLSILDPLFAVIAAACTNEIAVQAQTCLHEQCSAAGNVHI